MREITVSNHLPEALEEKRRVNGGRIVLGLAIFLLSLIPSALIGPGFSILGIGLLFVFWRSAFFSTTEKKILESGVRGEGVLKERLGKILSDEYIGLFSLPLPGGDIDGFVVGPTGAYLFDVKNHKGYVLYCDGRWSLDRVGKGGRIYSSDHLGNPSFQVRRGIFEVKAILQERGIDLWIEGVVVFTNPEVEVFSDDGGWIKVIRVDGLEELFRGRKSYLPPKRVEEIANLILKRFNKGMDLHGSA